MASEPSLRLSDAEREAVVSQPRDGYRDGRLDVDEFHRRVDLAYAAKIHGEVIELTSDLPETTPVPSKTRRGSRGGAVSRGVSTVWGVWFVILVTGGGVQGWWPSG